MSRLSVLAVAALVFLPFSAAWAGTQTSPANPSPSQSSSSGQPDLVSFGADYADFDKTEPHTQAADFRLEYRWGASLWSSQNSVLDFGIHPLAGAEAATRGQLYGFGGLGFDLLFWKHFVFTETEVAGLFNSGEAKPLGSVIEFRSQAELGWRFDNDMRMTASIGHISNAGLTRHNPGEEMVGAYLHVPAAMLFGD